MSRQRPSVVGRRRRLLRSIVAVVLATTVALVTAIAYTAERTPAGTDLAMRLRTREALLRIRPTPITLIAPVMRAAVVATEDERFYDHHGVDAIGIFRAVPYDLRHWSLRQGASTITEQVAKLLYLDGNDHSFPRKLKAAVLAFKLERHNSKDQILAAYLNSVYFGDGAYGIGAASRHYFARPPSELTLADASLLAGLVQAPSAYDPFIAPMAARRRQVDVLRSMVRNGSASETAARASIATPLRLRDGSTPLPTVRATFPRHRHIRRLQLIIGAALILASVVLLTVPAERLEPSIGWRVTALVSALLGLLELFVGFAI